MEKEINDFTFSTDTGHIPLSPTKMKPFHLSSFSEMDSVARRKLDAIQDTLGVKNLENPVLVIDVGVAVEVVNEWRRLMPRVELYYALKANPDERLAAALLKLGCGFDCASANEIRTMLKTGCGPDKIAFSNPAKFESHLTYAAKNGINLLPFDSTEELDKIHRFHPNCSALLRIRVDNPSCFFNLSSKFGAELEDAPRLLRDAKTAGVDVIGVSFHVGSGGNNAAAFAAAIKDAASVFKIGAALGMKMTTLNLGGGFPAFNFDGPAISVYAETINEALETHFDDKRIRVLAEPGRHVCARTTGILLRVHSKRVVVEKSGDRKGNLNFYYYLNDGIYGNMICAKIGHNALSKVFFFTKENIETSERSCSTLWGPTCDSCDCLAKDVWWPELQIGDYVLIDDVGAYGPYMATNFNGFGMNLTEVLYV